MWPLTEFSDAYCTLANERKMYSIGIVLFEMCYPLLTAMERVQVLGKLREAKHNLPSVFEEPEKLLQGEIVEMLVNHKASERPSSAELLRSGKIPLQVEDETIRTAVQGLSDPHSPYYSKLMNALFSQREEADVGDYTYDMMLGPTYTSDEFRLKSLVKDKLIEVFRRHGAIETQTPLLLPSSSYYNNTAVRLLNVSGKMVQLPYDLTLSNARFLARQLSPGRKTFAFANVYREAAAGTHPRCHGEVDFDIVSYDNLDLALREAETIKVLDEIIDAFPSFPSVTMCYHLNHSYLLNFILAFCEIAEGKRRAVKEIISKLNIGSWTWAKIRNELRAPGLAVASISLDDLMKFDFRDTIEGALPKLRLLLQNTEDLESTFTHLQAVTTYLNRFNVKRKVYINPLSSFNDKFYSGNVVFQCIYDTKKRDVFAAGGRYDRLIQEHRPNLKAGDRHAVGFNLGWERLFTSTSRFQNSSSKHFLKRGDDQPSDTWLPTRCDVQVDSFNPEILRSTGIQITQELWANGISAELVIDSGTKEGLGHSQNKDDTNSHNWIILIKPDGNVKVRSVLPKEDTDIRRIDLIGWLRNEIRERDRLEGKVLERSARLLRYSSQQDPSMTHVDREHYIKVLMGEKRLKKGSRKSIVGDGLFSLFYLV